MPGKNISTLKEGIDMLWDDVSELHLYLTGKPIPKQMHDEENIVLQLLDRVVVCTNALWRIGEVVRRLK